MRDLRALLVDHAELAPEGAGRAFTRRQLFAAVWRDGADELSRSVDIHIHRIRRKLGPEYGRRLVTVRRVGYLYQQPAEY